jgi:hypothetical protein
MINKNTNNKNKKEKNTMTKLSKNVMSDIEKYNELRQQEGEVNTMENTMKNKSVEYHKLSLEDQKKHVDFNNQKLWILYFIKDPLVKGLYKIGRSSSQYHMRRRLSALKGKMYHYGTQLELVTTKWHTKVEIMRLENLLKRKYKKNKEIQRCHVYREIGDKLIKTSSSVQMNGGTEWVLLNDEEVKDVLSHYEYKEVKLKEAA